MPGHLQSTADIIAPACYSVQELRIRHKALYPFGNGFQGSMQSDHWHTWQMQLPMLGKLQALCHLSPHTESSISAIQALS